MKPILRSDNPECDWTEDFEHENGNYQCHCYKCDRYFTGYKRRVVCKSCSSIPHTENNDFLQYVKNEREAITAELYSDWLQKLPKERVAIENLLIAYDQMAERLRTPSPSGGIKSAEPTYLSRLEVYEQVIKEKGKRLNSESVMLMLDRWGNIEYAKGLKDAFENTKFNKKDLAIILKLLNMVSDGWYTEEVFESEHFKTPIEQEEYVSKLIKKLS